MTKPLSVFYMCEPGRLEWQSVLLSASLREFCRDDFSIHAYCSASRFAQLDPRTLDYHEAAGIDIIPIEPEAAFERANLAGLYQRNKIVACAHERNSDYSLFMDTDMALVDGVSFAQLSRPNAIHALPAYRQPGAGGHIEDALWDQLYRKFGLPTPPDCIKGKSAGEEVLHKPYFNAGFLLFPERAATSQASLGMTWIDVASAVDADSTIPAQKGFLDQTTLPIAIAKAGLSYRCLDRSLNQALPRTGKLSPRRLRDVKIIHYHVGENLIRFERRDLLDQLLQRHTPYSSCHHLIESYGSVGFEQRAGVARKMRAKAATDSTA